MHSLAVNFTNQTVERYRKEAESFFRRNAQLGCEFHKSTVEGYRKEAESFFRRNAQLGCEFLPCSLKTE